MRGTGGTHSVVVGEGREKQPQVLRLLPDAVLLVDGQDDRSVRIRVLSPVPECEGPGAPILLWWVKGAKSNHRSFDSVPLKRDSAQDDTASVGGARERQKQVLRLR